MTTTAPPRLPGVRGDRALVVTLVLLTTVTAIVSSLGAPLIVAIARRYDVALTDAQWALTATLLSGAVATPILGRLGAGRWRRPAVLAGLAVVCVGSLLGALPLGFGALVVGRALQGVGLALVPLAIAIARDHVAAPALPRTVALLSVTTVAGAGAGYPLSAFLAEHGGVAGAYAVGGVLTTITLALAALVLPHGDDDAGGSVDWVGAGLLSGGMVATLLAVSRGETWGWDSTRVLSLLAAGVVVLLAWGWWTLRVDGPLVDLRLAVRPGLAAPNLVAFAAGCGMYTLLALVVVVVQSAPRDGFGLGRSTLVAGSMLAPYAVASVVGSRLAQGVGRLAGTRLLLPTGCGLFLAATLLLADFHDHVLTLTAIMALSGLGSGFTFSSLAVLMVPHVPPAETGSAMAFNQVLRYLGFSVGSALSVTLMEVYGGGDAGFRGSLLTMSSVWVVALGGTWVLHRVSRP